MPQAVTPAHPPARQVCQALGGRQQTLALRCSNPHLPGPRASGIPSQVKGEIQCRAMSFCVRRAGSRASAVAVTVPASTVIPCTGGASVPSQGGPGACDAQGQRVANEFHSQSQGEPDWGRRCSCTCCTEQITLIERFPFKSWEQSNTTAEGRLSEGCAELSAMGVGWPADF
jgi:hypothetical protein